MASRGPAELEINARVLTDEQLRLYVGGHWSGATLANPSAFGDVPCSRG
ncbi:MAG: hypothetical protein ABR591_09590 [Candidatus Velthaea sp.]